jgi:hypothetical protein
LKHEEHEEEKSWLWLPFRILRVSIFRFDAPRPGRKKTVVFAPMRLGSACGAAAIAAAQDGWRNAGAAKIVAFKQ